jgi:hypothetical protein
MALLLELVCHGRSAAYREHVNRASLCNGSALKTRADGSKSQEVDACACAAGLGV